MNVKDRQLSSLNVQVDLVSVVKVLTHDEYVINNAEGFNQGTRPDLSFATDRCIYCDVKEKCCTIICRDIAGLYDEIVVGASRGVSVCLSD